MKKYACNRLYKSPEDILSQSIVTINERGEVEGLASLGEEVSATEWLGGIIILSDKRMMSPQQNFKELLEYLAPVEKPIYAWHISNFDFQQEEISPQSIIKRL